MSGPQDGLVPNPGPRRVKAEKTTEEPTSQRCSCLGKRKRDRATHVDPVLEVVQDPGSTPGVSKTARQGAGLACQGWSKRTEMSAHQIRPGSGAPWGLMVWRRVLEKELNSPTRRFSELPGAAVRPYPSSRHPTSVSSPPSLSGPRRDSSARETPERNGNA